MDAVKAAHASLVVLFTESARHDVDSFMLKCMLEDYKLAPERVNFIIETYIKCKVHTQQRLRLIGTHFPHIIDVHWKMDYTVRVNLYLELIHNLFLKVITSYIFYLVNTNIDYCLCSSLVEVEIC